MRNFLIKISPYWYLLSKNRFSFFIKSSLLISLAKLFFKKRFSKNIEQQIKIGHFKIYFPNSTVASILLKEKFVLEEYFLQLSENPIIIDCGSSIGISALYFKTIYPRSKIYCFEPNPDAYNYLLKNINGNDLQDITIEQKAVSLINGKINLVHHKTQPYLNSFTSDETTPESICVNSISLSSYLKKFSEIDLIKLDIEGKEYEVISELFASNILDQVIVKNFVIEYHYLYSKNKEDFKKFTFMLDKMGYVLKKRSSMYPDNFDDEVFFFTKHF